MHRDRYSAGTRSVDTHFQKNCSVHNGYLFKTNHTAEGFFCYRAGLYVRANQLWNMHNLAPNAKVKACKNRCRKVEMCLG